MKEYISIKRGGIQTYLYVDESGNDIIVNKEAFIRILKFAGFEVTVEPATPNVTQKLGESND
ncbi:hypothetical protein DRO59_07755 [Candidatus Bathyarchaeota archaeon]|nr:MAG: hypothetical protein DRO59_07755 [Candidatus Bathyarchaeota archaeon]